MSGDAVVQQVCGGEVAQLGGDAVVAELCCGCRWRQDLCGGASVQTSGGDAVVQELGGGWRIAAATLWYSTTIQATLQSKHSTFNQGKRAATIKLSSMTTVTTSMSDCAWYWCSNAEACVAERCLVSQTWAMSNVQCCVVWLLPCRLLHCCTCSCLLFVAMLQSRPLLCHPTPDRALNLWRSSIRPP